jgi:hypothetical protein
MCKFRIQRGENLKEKALAYLGGKVCKQCGINSLHQKCYDFHHYKGQKETELSKMIQANRPWSEIEGELKKCVVLCKNCHSALHSGMLTQGFNNLKFRIQEIQA